MEAYEAKGSHMELYGAIGSRRAPYGAIGINGAPLEVIGSYMKPQGSKSGLVHILYNICLYKNFAFENNRRFHTFNTTNNGGELNILASLPLYDCYSAHGNVLLCFTTMQFVLYITNCLVTAIQCVCIKIC